MKKFLIACSAIIVFTLFVLGALLAYIANKAEQDTAVRSDIILVLGGTVTSGTSCVGPICDQIGFVPNPHDNPCVVARVKHGVSLYKNGYAPKILMSGGTDEDGTNEAEAMKRIAVDAGVPEADILMEKESTSTYENLAFSRSIIAGAGARSVIVVTEPYHIARAGLVAAKLDYDYSLSPADSPCWIRDDFFANWRFIKRELFGIVIYKVLNRL